MQSVSSRLWTHVAVSISYDDNHYTSGTPSIRICYIRLWCDWLFRPYHHINYICYFVASYLFSLLYDWFLRCCFVLLFGEIKFLSSGFLFLATSTFSHVRCCLLAVKNTCFSSHFCFLFIVILLVFDIIIIIYSLEFFTSVLADGLSREFEWQQVSSSLQDSFQYSGCSQLWSSLDGLHSSVNFQVLQSV